jgi:uncharacterized Tic20 family protein
MENTPASFQSSLTSEEKMFALFSHLSVVLGGIILPIILWALQKDKSKFVRFHSLQAIFYHISITAMIMILIFFLVFGILIGVFVSIGSKNYDNSSAAPVLFGLSMVIFYVFLFAILFASIGYGIYLAVKSYEGKLVRIPIIGNIIYKKVYGNQ